MSRTCQRNAFTLIEVLIVVIIMAVLAATIIPQFTSSTQDAVKSTIQFNLHTMRSQIQVYKMHHLGKLPTDASTFKAQMTKQTDIDGVLADPGPYGPYMQEVPANPLNGLDTVVPGNGSTAIDAGWQYDDTTGMIYSGPFIP